MRLEDKFFIQNKAEDVRNAFFKKNTGPIDFLNITTLVPGLTIVERPFSKSLNGLILKYSCDEAIISINSKLLRYQYNEIFAHELYHFFNSGECFKATPDKSILTSDPLTEEMADYFASYLLMPRREFLDLFQNKFNSAVSLKTLFSLSNYFHVGYEMVLKRFAEENITFSIMTTSELTVTYAINFMEKVGLSTDLYKQVRQDDKIYVFGKYPDLANKLFVNEKISESKLNELLSVE